MIEVNNNCLQSTKIMEETPASRDAGVSFGIKRREVEKCFGKQMLSTVTVPDKFEQSMTELKTKFNIFVNGIASSRALCRLNFKAKYAMLCYDGMLLGATAVANGDAGRHSDLNH